MEREITRREAIGVLAGAALAVPFAGLLASCGPAPYVSPYDWTALRREGERLVYAPDGQVESSWGIDVSSHQFSINWQEVAAAGVQFAIIRIGNRGATEGLLYEDEFFMENATGAQAAGIPLGAYFFSQALDEAEVLEEAEFALRLLAKAEQEGAQFKAVAYDHEPVSVEGARANDLEGELLSQLTVTFCQQLELAGYQPLLYGNQRDLGKLDPVVRQAYPLWLAEYETDAPTAQFDFRIWQYSRSGQLPGIPADVDLNILLPEVE